MIPSTDERVPQHTAKHVNEQICRQTEERVAQCGSFLLQHAVQGWCPPLPVFRSYGVRNQSEIDYERYSLKSLRGNFRKLLTADGDGASAKQVVETMRQ